MYKIDPTFDLDCALPQPKEDTCNTFQVTLLSSSVIWYGNQEFFCVDQRKYDVTLEHRKQTKERCSERRNCFLKYGGSRRSYVVNFMEDEITAEFELDPLAGNGLWSLAASRRATSGG